MTKPKGNRTAKSEETDLAAKWLKKFRNNPIVAVAIFFGLIVTGLGAFWNSLPEGFKAAASAPFTNRPIDLPGETGWIFVGYYRQEDGVFIEGPKVEVINSNMRARTRFVEIGDTVRVKSVTRVFMVDFKSVGPLKKLTSPVEKGVISTNDETGVTVKPDAELIVRDVSAGAWPGNPNAALWARIVLAKMANSP